MKATLTDEQSAALDAARVLAASGVPIFVARRDPKATTGFRLPKGWQHTQADPAVVDRWRPGMALCAVMGQGVDAVDVDPRNGGDESFAALREDGQLPRVYATADTPSGGRHYLVASLGAASRDGVLPGVDVKAGDEDGHGRGFVFVAPTVKASKTTGEPAPYRWTEPPGVDLEMVCLVGGDDSGAALRALVAETRQDGPTQYDGPTYDELSEGQRRVAYDYVDGKVAHWRAALAAAADWPEGERDAEGRGWEALARDAAWAMAALAATPWTGIEVEHAALLYENIVPEEIANDERCAGKWSPDLVAKVRPEQLDAPPWADFEPVAGDEGDFWQATPTLAHIRQAAHARMLSAPALLAEVLGRVLAEVPPRVVLPPVIGDPASLNIGVAVVGKSGSGKSALLGASRHVLGLEVVTQDEIERNVGSGEGLAQSFLVGTKDGNILVDDPRRIFTVDEIDSLAAKQSRQGATLGADLRTMLTGGALGQANAERLRNRHVPAGAYRAVLFAGVQPTRSGALLRDTDAGTPQRFLWVSATDPSIPATPPPHPGPLRWSLPTQLPRAIDYPDAIKEQVRQARLRQNRGDGEPVEGHRLLLQLKVATALAVLHSETAISDAWWAVAGQLVADSMRLQQECERVLGEAATNASRQKGHHAAIEKEAEAEYHSAEVEKNAKRIAREIHAHAQEQNARRKHAPDAGCTRACVTNGLRHAKPKPSKETREEALALAQEQGWVVERDGRWHPGPEKPPKR